METLLMGTLQHAKKYLQSKKEDQEEIILAAKRTIIKELTETIPWLGETSLEERSGPVEINQTHTATEMAHRYTEEHGKQEVTLPEEFKCHTALFSDEQAKAFPPARGEGDHKIELLETAPASFNCKVYPLSKAEQEAEDQFLDENLAKGCIVPSNSPYRFSTFMVPKKDLKEKRYIIDYCPLNAVTCKDVTPLPNLAQYIEDLQGMEVFSKFNIWWGYNNIRIKEGDKWKGAFKTRQGLFEPKVMFFGMSNSPGSFQRFVNNKIMEKVYQKFGSISHKCLKNYMDDFRLGTKLKVLLLHIKITHFLFDLLAEHSLHLKLSKSIFMQPQMDFLSRPTTVYGSSDATTMYLRWR